MCALCLRDHYSWGNIWLFVILLIVSIIGIKLTSAN